jgi:hypothetical protein
MSQTKFFGKLLSWLIGVTVLGFFYAGEALAVCCKSSTGCSCTTALSCISPKIKVSSCSTGAGSITGSGSQINCAYSQGDISADPTGSPTKTAIWSETALGVRCNKTDGVNLIGEESSFDLNLEFKLAAPAPCVKGVRTYDGDCPAAIAKGTLIAKEPVPQWVKDMCTDENGILLLPQQCENSPNGFMLVLGGTILKNNGEPDTQACQKAFVNQAPTGLPAKKVLFQTERFTDMSCNGARTTASDPKRRTFHGGTFYNPDYNPTDGTGATCPPGGCQGGNIIHVFGTKPTDLADIKAARLDDNAWEVPTQNLSCSNQGIVPTTVNQSGTNILVAGFTLDDGPVVAYVTDGNPNDTSPAISVEPFKGGSRVTFTDCQGGGGNGFVQVICRNINHESNPQTVNMTILATQNIETDGEGLGYIGTRDVDLNNAKLNCPKILNP